MRLIAPIFTEALLAACASPGACCVPTIAPPAIETTALPQVTPAAATALPIPNCAPSALQPEPGTSLTLIARVVDCPDLVLVEQAGGAVLAVARATLGLADDVLSTFPEEVR